MNLNGDRLGLLGWPVTLPDLDLPTGWSTREDGHFLYVLNGIAVAGVFSTGISREALAVSVRLMVRQAEGRKA